MAEIADLLKDIERIKDQFDTFRDVVNSLKVDIISTINNHNSSITQELIKLESRVGHLEDMMKGGDDRTSIETRLQRLETSIIKINSQLERESVWKRYAGYVVSVITSIVLTYYISQYIKDDNNNKPSTEQNSEN